MQEDCKGPPLTAPMKCPGMPNIAGFATYKPPAQDMYATVRKIGPQEQTGNDYIPMACPNQAMDKFSATGQWR